MEEMSQVKGGWPVVSPYKCHVPALATPASLLPRNSPAAPCQGLPPSCLQQTSMLSSTWLEEAAVLWAGAAAMAPQNQDTLHLTHSPAMLSCTPGKGHSKAPAPRAVLICHKAAQSVLMHEGGSSAQTPCKCNLVLE